MSVWLMTSAGFAIGYMVGALIAGAKLEQYGIDCYKNGYRQAINSDKDLDLKLEEWGV